MSWKRRLGLIVLLLGAPAAEAQDPPAASGSSPALPAQSLAQPSTDPATGLEAESRLARLFGDENPSPAPKLGPTPVEDVRILQDRLGGAKWFGASGVRTFGWLEGGYTYATTGPGSLATQPRENRFGNEFLLNQLGLVLERPLQRDQFSVGFNVTYFAGADPALIQPKGGIDSPPGDPRFSHDFRQLYVSAHLPILTEGGVDIKAGRMGTIIGYNGALSPYRPFYSSDYQWFYSQDGAWTGVLTNWHVNERLDILHGLTFGANTFFEMRSDDSVCYIGQINYWLQEEKKTLVTASVHAGPNAIFAAPGLAGSFVTVLELRAVHNWSPYCTQVVQSNMGWDADTPVGTGSWYGLYTIGIVHLNHTIDSLVRVEWFRDVRGTRTGIDAHYSEVTLGLNWHPKRYLEFRPEVRADFADKPAFGSGGVPRDQSQLTAALSFLLKF